MVVVDPRRTETAKLADHWVPVKPGTDTALLIAILARRAGCAGLRFDTMPLDGFGR